MTLLKNIHRPMSRRLTMFVVLLLTAIAGDTGAWAKPPKGDTEADRKEADRRRVNYAQAQARLMACDMDLSAADSARFVKTYMAYQSELWEISKPPRKPGPDFKPTQADAKREMERRFKQAQAMLDLQKKYYNIYLQFLTPEQVEYVFSMERELISHIYDQMGGPKHGHGPDGKHGHGPGGRPGGHGHPDGPPPHRH